MSYYERNESRIDLAFFLGGFLFDVVTLTDVDDPLGIAQQLVYLFIIGGILFYELVLESRPRQFTGLLEKAWGYRSLAVHFFLGSLFSLYSLYFLKSSSFFSSFLFVVLLMAVMVGNELKVVKERGTDVKIGLFLICLFCFLSTVIPVALGFVGWTPFLLSVGVTAAFLFAMKKALSGTVPEQWIRRRVLVPGAAVLAAFTLLYMLALIPPVPLSAKKMGIYHNITKEDGKYLLHHERPWWKFWRSGDQEFRAAPGDKIFLFASIFSPGRFDDSVVLHWWQKDTRGNWQTTDRIPMRVTGGRQGGYRGFATKSNFTPGRWGVSVESTDGREIGRIYFTVEAAEPRAPEHVWEVERY